MSEELEFIDMQDNKKKKSKKQKKFNVYTIMMIICILIFLGCAVWIVKYFIDTNKANNELDNIRDEYVSETPTVPTVEEPVEEEKPKVDIISTYSVPELSIDFEALQTEQNPDIYAWIYIPNTQVDYPILQHPTALDYYLEYNIDGSKGYPGCIYTQLLNNKEFTDNHTVIYGHNMKNGSMFANLHYFEDPEFFDANPYVYIYTTEGAFVYEIIGAYEYNNMHLLLSIAMDEYDTFDSYIKGIYNNDGLNSNFRDEIELSGDDKIITLSTCISGKSEKRFLVQAVLVASERDGVVREDLEPIVPSEEN